MSSDPREVEIPEVAVQAAHDVLHPHREVTEEYARLALAAALPHLRPAIEAEALRRAAEGMPVEHEDWCAVDRWSHPSVRDRCDCFDAEHRAWLRSRADEIAPAITEGTSDA